MGANILQSMMPLLSVADLAFRVLFVILARAGRGLFTCAGRQIHICLFPFFFFFIPFLGPCFPAYWQSLECWDLVENEVLQVL